MSSVGLPFELHAEKRKDSFLPPTKSVHSELTRHAQPLPSRANSQGTRAQSARLLFLQRFASCAASWLSGVTDSWFFFFLFVAEVRVCQYWKGPICSFFYSLMFLRNFQKQFTAGLSLPALPLAYTFRSPCFSALQSACEGGNVFARRHEFLKNTVVVQHRYRIDSAAATD